MIIFDWSYYAGLTPLIILYSDILIVFNKKKTLADKQGPAFWYDWFHGHNQDTQTWRQKYCFQVFLKALS